MQPLRRPRVERVCDDRASVATNVLLFRSDGNVKTSPGHCSLQMKCTQLYSKLAVVRFTLFALSDTRHVDHFFFFCWPIASRY